MEIFSRGDRSKLKCSMSEDGGGDGGGDDHYYYVGSADEDKGRDTEKESGQDERQQQQQQQQQLRALTSAVASLGREVKMLASVGAVAIGMVVVGLIFVAVIVHRKKQGKATAGDGDVSSYVPPASCEQGWKGNLQVGACYLFPTSKSERMTWRAAERYCRKGTKDSGPSAFLAEVKTKGQQTYLTDWIRVFGRDCWLGGTDEEREGAWVWAHSGEAVAGDVAEAFFERTDPGGGVEESCMGMQAAGRRPGAWFDYKCDDEDALAYPICQYIL